MAAELSIPFSKLMRFAIFYSVGSKFVPSMDFDYSQYAELLLCNATVTGEERMLLYEYF
jgi:hypothetical protein